MNICDHSSVIPRGIDTIEGQNTFLDTLTDQVVLALKRAYVDVSELRRLVNSASSVSCESAKKIFYLKLFMLVIPEVHAFSGWDNRCMDILRVAATISSKLFDQDRDQTRETIYNALILIVRKYVDQDDIDTIVDHVLSFVNENNFRNNKEQFFYTLFNVLVMRCSSAQKVDRREFYLINVLIQISSKVHVRNTRGVNTELFHLLIGKVENSPNFGDHGIFTSLYRLASTVSRKEALADALCNCKKLDKIDRFLVFAETLQDREARDDCCMYLACALLKKISFVVTERRGNLDLMLIEKAIATANVMQEGARKINFIDCLIDNILKEYVSRQSQPREVDDTITTILLLDAIRWIKNRAITKLIEIIKRIEKEETQQRVIENTRDILKLEQFNGKLQLFNELWQGTELVSDSAKTELLKGMQGLSLDSELG